MSTETKSVKKGGFNSGKSRKLAYICPTKWFTPIKGTLRDNDIPLAKLVPTSSEPINPGP